MSYSIKEIFFTLQGEGFNAGRAAVFCRFTGCNLWSGHEEDRTEAICQFCDTDFVGTDGMGGGRFHSAVEVAQAVSSRWPENRTEKVQPLVVCTGGEPLLQLDEDLVTAFHREGFEVAIETNGTRLPPNGVDWVCVSPKAGAELVLRSGDELKLVFPQVGAEPELYEHLDFKHFFLQPMDGASREENTRLALQYCLRHPQWRLSLQTHKFLGIP
ncbi:MAG: 7-carboxy-7-deazaguanine synthase [Acidobacteria bacterium]|nr:MAG: 7-carboxy-7-deazaguanine synthase [Acidobacteriota bacterium]